MNRLQISSTTMSNTLTSLVPIFDGTNYLSWSPLMDAYLGFQGILSVVNDKWKRPSGTTDADKDEQAKWDQADQQARGAIILRLSTAIRNLVISKTKSKEIWEYLKETYGQAGLSTIYADFKRLAEFRISGNDPRPDIALFKELIDRLTTNEVKLDEFIKSMMFINALPAKYGTIISIIMQGDRKELEVDKIATHVIAEHDRTTSTNQVNKMTAIKRKQGDPSFKQQKQQQPDKPNDGNKPKGNRGNAGGKKKKDKKNKKQQNQYQHQHHSHYANGEISNFASAVLLGPHVVDLNPHVPQQMTASVATFTPEGPVVRQAPINLPTKAFSKVQGAKISKASTTSSWPTVAQAQKICDSLKIPRTAHNLRILEESGAAASTSDDVGAPPAKRARTESPPVTDTEDAVSIGDDHDSLFGDDIKDADAMQLDTGFVNDARCVTRTNLSNHFANISSDPQPLRRLHGRRDSNVINLSDYSDDVYLDLCIALNSIDACLNRLDSKIAKCAQCENPDFIMWILDSGASIHVTGDITDFHDYRTITNGPKIQTAKKDSQLSIQGVGSIFVEHVARKQEGTGIVKTRISPVFHIPNLNTRLLSLGEFLQQPGTVVVGNKTAIGILGNRMLQMICRPRKEGDTIYWLKSRIVDQKGLAHVATVHSVDYETIHRRFGHASKQVLERAKRNTKNFPQNVEIPAKTPLCRGCAQGRMPSDSHPPSETRAKAPFDKIHSDLKSFPTESYHRYKYYASFLDDFSGHAWVVLLRQKSDTCKAVENFIQMVKNKYRASIRVFMTDGGGEYKSREMEDLLRSAGITSETSVPHTPQQNGRAERLNRTIMDKAESMRLHACIPESWWEFSVLHAVHIYNRTPMRRLNWKTPYELIEGEAPDVSRLRVFGCGAYVYLPEAVRANKLSPKSEMMTFLGFPEGGKGYLFMRSPNNVLFTAHTATFDETYFPKCPDSKVPRGNTRTGDRPSEKQKQKPSDYPPPESGDEGDEDDIPRRFPTQRGNQPRPGNNPRADSPPPQPPVQPQAPQQAPRGRARGQRGAPPPAPVRRSSRVRNPATRPDNTYGERNPTDVEKMKQKEWKQTVGDNEERPSRSRTAREPAMAPGPSAQVPAPPPTSDAESSSSGSEEESSGSGSGSDGSKDEEAELLSRLAREGGVEFMNWMLSKAVTPDAPTNLPQKSTREWTFRDIMRLPEHERKEWWKACLEEIEALKKRKVFDLVDLPPGRKAIKCRWVFDIKSDGRKRARLVAKGFSQVEGIDFNEIFSPVVRYESVRILLALAALENWYITAVDVKTAFLYGKLDEEIYMEQPEGFAVKGQERKVFRLRRALYGLKQASNAWYKELVASMKLLNFTRLSTDTGLFIYQDKQGNFVIVVAYVDDLLFMGPKRHIVDEQKERFKQKWECRDLGEPKEFLRMRIRRKNGKIYLDQTDYLKKVLERFQMMDCRIASTPMVEGYKPLPNDGPIDEKLRTLYQSIIGSLLYLMLGTRPDIAYAVTKLAQQAANPSKEHLNKALYICKYLRGTMNYSLVLDGKSQTGLIAYSDSDHASDPVKRRSTTGYIVKLATAAVSWSSHAQKTVATSSTEAEYMALSDCCRQVMWIRHMFNELGLSVDKVPICTDNNGAIFIGSNPIQERRIKHIDVRYHYIRECVEDGNVEILRVDTTENTADLLTKPLGKVKFVEFRSQLGLEFYSDQSA